MPNFALSGNPRYQPKELQAHFGYDNLYRPVAQVELAVMRTLAEIGVIPQQDMDLLTADIEEQLLNIKTSMVDLVEKQDTPGYGKATKHDIRAWIRLAQDLLPIPLRRWVHVPLTSYDVLDTARTLQFLEAHQVVRDMTYKVMSHLIDHVRTHAKTPQIGRTHGQHALPITVGFWFATILNRILVSIKSTDEAASMLVGKISGAVGAYNAQVGLGFAERCGEYSFEGRVLDRLGLKSGRISTQILQPEPLSDYLFGLLKLSAALGQFGLDCRQLMRTEIAEIGEPFDEGQSGSSTMAHKRNPMTFENLEGTWKKNKAEFFKVLECMTSEHQRDLVGSSLARDFPTIVVNVVSQLGTLLRETDKVPFIKRVSVNTHKATDNVYTQGDRILAEPLYIALQMYGYEGDAHALVNHGAVKQSNKTGRPLMASLEAILDDYPGAREAWGAVPEDLKALFRDSKGYWGHAAEKALEVADAADRYLRLYRPRE